MHLSDQGLAVILLFGLIAGWLAGKVDKATGLVSSGTWRLASSPH